MSLKSSTFLNFNLTMLSAIALLHADDGYSRRRNFGGALVCSMVSIYLPDGTNVHGSRSREFEGIGSV